MLALEGVGDSVASIKRQTHRKVGAQSYQSKELFYDSGVARKVASAACAKPAIFS